jgi:hypothetical protein
MSRPRVGWRKVLKQGRAEVLRMRPGKSPLWVNDKAKRGLMSLGLFGSNATPR